MDDHLMGLSVDELLAGKPRLRTKAVNYGPGLDFDLHSFTSGAYRREMAKLAKDELEEAVAGETGVGPVPGDKIEDEVVIRLAMKLMQGEDFEATKEQVLAFKEKLDEGVIRSIVNDGLAFNRGADDLADAAKKS